MAQEDTRETSVSASRASTAVHVLEKSEDSAGQTSEDNEPKADVMTYREIVSRYLENSTLLGLRSIGDRSLTSSERLWIFY